MLVLGHLDLSENQLSGEVPLQLGKMESLIQLNISHNHFQGNLPSTGAFLAINSSAVAGNDLCGGDETSGLPPCKVVNHRYWWFFFVICPLVALVLLVVAAFGFIFIRRRNNLKPKRVENEDGIWEFQFFDSNISKSITVDDITLPAKEVNGICRGKSFVVKEMKEVNSTITSTFWSEIKRLGKLQHPNIVNLIGTCRSDKGAYLFYQYIEGKLLSETLHNLTWEKRQKVATGIAKALRFLHSYCSPTVIVGDMSPERVTIDGKDEPRLWLSLPGPVSIANKPFISSAYVSPEAREGKDMSEKNDIYGFGLILIELLTGKSPDDDEFREQHQSMVEWARYCYSDCHLDMWVDPMIKPGQASNVNQSQIVEAMNLALHCTAGDPMARPSSTDVSKTLQSAFKITSCVSTLKFPSTV
ncbi:homeobox-leucine zipper protein ATHB-8-like [Hibiscus syriacus]|uniref:non-specific serine/threonine protein kinase n=1 Tax=Hibiscus syriacus TaxID=106335 RepID=A0A6A3CZR9_HIBSY|nr:homeobox-leucine zipper protein ATHB-8-like [Hibiscus syriacus]